MTRPHVIGIVDYGVGNHASVIRALRSLGYRCRFSADPELLESTDLLVLPGVGAFPSAMKALQELDLVGFIQSRARSRPVLGICLGMQLLADSSEELGSTVGLGLIPGEVVPLVNPAWHIGWNTMDLALPDPLFYETRGQGFYFNHSYTFRGDEAYQVCHSSDSGNRFPVVIRRDNIVGVQFHPEKSQEAGRRFLGRLVGGLCDA